MFKRRLTAFVSLILAFVAGMAATPSPLDPVRVAPHIYETAFENERVRVIRKTIRHGETAPLHSHKDRVVVYLNPCGWMEDDGKGGERMQSYGFGEPVWAAAETHGGETATVIQQCSVLLIELLE